MTKRSAWRFCWWQWPVVSYNRAEEALGSGAWGGPREELGDWPGLEGWEQMGEERAKPSQNSDWDGEGNTAWLEPGWQKVGPSTQDGLDHGSPSHLEDTLHTMDSQPCVLMRIHGGTLKATLWVSYVWKISGDLGIRTFIDFLKLFLFKSQLVNVV